MQVKVHDQLIDKLPVSIGLWQGCVFVVIPVH